MSHMCVSDLVGDAGVARDLVSPALEPQNRVLMEQLGQEENSSLRGTEEKE